MSSSTYASHDGGCLVLNAEEITWTTIGIDCIGYDCDQSYEAFGLEGARTYCEHVAVASRVGHTGLFGLIEVPDPSADVYCTTAVQ